MQGAVQSERQRVVYQGSLDHSTALEDSGEPTRCSWQRSWPAGIGRVNSSPREGIRWQNSSHSLLSKSSSSNSSEDIYCASDTRCTGVKKYEMLHTLGHGTYGKVKLAKDVAAQHLFAVKTISKRKIAEKDDLLLIRREIEIMAFLHHPNIIHIREVLENSECIIIVMEYASGGELFDYLCSVKLLSENESRRIFRQVVSAVYFCHKNFIAHRDLKLENILLDSRGNVKIVDFGLSSTYSYDRYLHTFCGSPLYAAPEIINGRPYHGPEIDCWSLGVILYTLVYGKMPFDGPEFGVLCQQISNGQYVEPADVSMASDLIRSILIVNPEERATISDIAHHWWLNRGTSDMPVTHLPENMSYSDIAHNLRTVSSIDPKPIPGSLTSSAYRRRTSPKSCPTAFPSNVQLFKAATMDFAPLGQLVNPRTDHRLESLIVQEPDPELPPGAGLLMRRLVSTQPQRKYEGHDSGCVLDDDSSTEELCSVGNGVLSLDEGIGCESDLARTRRRDTRPQFQEGSACDHLPTLTEEDCFDSLLTQHLLHHHHHKHGTSRRTKRTSDPGVKTELERVYDDAVNIVRGLSLKSDSFS